MRAVADGECALFDLDPDRHIAYFRAVFKDIHFKNAGKIIHLHQFEMRQIQS